MRLFIYFHFIYVASKRPVNFSWIDEGKLAAFGYPSSPQNLRYLLELGITYLVTLSPEKIPPIHSFPEFHWTEIKVREFHPPSIYQIDKFISVCEEAFAKGQAVGVHCRMGRGRTGTVAACYLVKFHGMSPQSAMGKIHRERPGSIETYSQEESVMEYYYYLCKKRQSQESQSQKETGCVDGSLASKS